MSTTDTPAKATSKGSQTKAKPEPEETQQQETTAANDEAQQAAQAKAADDARQEQEEAMEVLEPSTEPRRWVIGKPPQEGGNADEYSTYVQKPLSYMARMRFFALVSNTISDVIKEGGGLGAAGDILSGNIGNRARELTTDDFADAGSFMSLAMQLVGHAPDFLLECYCLWLDVPAAEKRWAKAVMNQPYDPDRQKWGLTDDQHIELVSVFIDQNYDDIRNFFSGKLPRLAQKVREREAARKARESESVPSKQ